MKLKLARFLPIALLLSPLSNSSGQFFQKRNANLENNLGELFSLNNFSISNEHKQISDVFINPSSNFGIEFNGGNGGTISYRNIVDLNEVDKNDNLIELVGNSSLDYSDLTKTIIELKNITIRISDAYDSSVYFEVNISQNETISQVPISSIGGGNNNLFYSVSYNGYTMANNSDYSPLEGKTVAWKQSLFNPSSYLDGSKGEYVPTGFKFDNKNNEVLVDLGVAASVSTSDPHNYVLFDLDDPTDSYPDFPGFTTGEVFISVSSKEIGKLAITKIGNDVFDSQDESLFEKNTGNLLTYGYDFENMIEGVKDCYYPLPKLYSNSSYSFEVFEGNDKVEPTNTQNFIPTKSGSYKVKISSSNYFGVELVKEGNFLVNELANPLIDNSGISSLEVKMFESFVIPSFSYSGGNGKISKDIKLVLDDEVILTSEGSNYIIESKYKQSYIQVDTSDEIRVTHSYKYPLNVDYNVKRFYIDDAFKTSCVTSGNDFAVPDYVAIDYSKEDVSKNNMDISIKRGKNTYYLPGDIISNVTSDFNLNYIFEGEVLETVKVLVSSSQLSTEGSDLSSYYRDNIGVSASCISDIGAMFTLEEGDSFINQPLNVSTTDLTISFCYMEEKSNYDEIDIHLQNIGGKEIVIGLKQLGEKPLLFINNERIYKSITVQQLTYLSEDSTNLLGKKYYKYSFVFSSENKSLYNANMSLVSSVSSFSDGSNFAGFKNSTAKISFEIGNHKKGDLFFLNQISNQQFTAQVLRFGDSRSSYIGFSSPFGNGIYKIGETVHIPSAYSYDAINSTSTISMNVVAPDGTYLLRNSNPISLDLVLDSYGVYIVTYSCIDGNDNSGSFSYRLVVNDDIAPEIMTNAAYQDSYVGKVYIYKAKAMDNIDGEVSVIAILKGPNATSRIVETGKETELELKGLYTLTYFAIDEAGNANSLTFEFVSK